MAATEARQRDWFTPLMTLTTVMVAVCSLYYSGVQADVARKTLEMNFNEAHAALQKDIADLQKQLAAGSSDRNLADVLDHLADLQARLAGQQRQAATGSGGGTLADVQQQMAEVQQAVARLKKDQQNKDQEIAFLRASLPGYTPGQIRGVVDRTSPCKPNQSSLLSPPGHGAVLSLHSESRMASAPYRVFPVLQACIRATKPHRWKRRLEDAGKEPLESDRR